MRLLLVLILSLLTFNGMAADIPSTARTAVFAGGCFWCMQPQYDNMPGVVKTSVGYSGGTVPNPTYEQVVSGKTGHKEVIQVTYDPAKVSFVQLVDTFWENIDPLDARGQFCDKGEQYAAAIFVADDAERSVAEASLKRVEAKLGQKVATQILPAMPFYPAEDYHQSFYLKNQLRYKMYSLGCGRDARLEDIWGKKAD